MKREGMQDFFLLMSIGKETDGSEFPADGKNVAIVKWADQGNVLARSSLAIFHGGLGTIKECIYHGVPMLVSPINRDQPANGERIEYHNLGASIDFNNITENELEDKIRYLVDCKSVKLDILKMRDRFIETDQQDLGVKVIESLLAKRKNPESQTRF